MTSQAILGDSLTGIATQTKSNISKSETIKRNDRDSFHRVMNNSQASTQVEKTKYHNMDKVYDNKLHMDKTIQDKRAEIASKMQKHMEQNRQTSINNDSSNSQVKPFIKEEFVEDVKDVINSIADAYTQTLEIEDEELISIMEQLGINLFQLPLEEVVKQVVLEANGESDITGLLVNEDALNSLNKLKEFFISYNPEEKLDMSLEEYSSLVQEAIDRLTSLDGEVSENITENADKDINSINNIADKNVLDTNLLNGNLEQNHISADEIKADTITNINTDNMLDANVKDNGLGNEVIQDNSMLETNISVNNQNDLYSAYTQSENANDALLNMENNNSSVETNNDDLLNLKGTIEINQNKKISVEITKSVDGLTNQDMGVKLDNSNITENVLNSELTGEQTLEDLVTNGIEDVPDTLDSEQDKGINNNDVNEYVLDKKDGLVANEPTSENTKDMMSDSKDTSGDTNNSSNSVDTKDAAIEFYDKFIANLEKSLGVGEGDMLNEMSHIKEMREVVEQLVDKIKVNINKDTTTMKMQLAPEHLGKLELEITSKSGILTAQIKVENATAKEAIESGLQTLIQKFDEQGVKVEAVEVSIANYDMSKDNGREKSSQDYEMDIKKKKKHGKISLEEINAMETEEEIKQENEIRKSMTATTIDYAV